jgi:hypothetical protein
METEPSTSTKQQHRQDRQDRQDRQYKQHIDSFFSRHFLEAYFHGKK